MGEDPNYYERAAISLVVLIKISAELVPSRHQSCDNQTGRAEERDQP
jgi:hypothetical protein